MNSIFCFISFTNRSAGADPGFQVRGGILKFFGGISCEKSRFYAKKIIFFPILGGGGTGCAPGLSPLSDALDGNFLFKQTTLETTPFHPF